MPKKVQEDEKKVSKKAKATKVKKIKVEEIDAKKIAKKEKDAKAKKAKKTKVEQKIEKLGSDANRSLSKYLQEISRFQPLSPDREVELAIKVKPIPVLPAVPSTIVPPLVINLLSSASFIIANAALS